MKVIINGLPLFSARLAADLKTVAPIDTIRFHDTYNSYAARIKFALDCRNADVFISMNGVSDSSGSLDLVIKKRIPMMMLWMGTDVSLALDRHHSGNINLTYIKYARHFTDSPLLKAELAILGINAEILHFKWINAFSSQNHPFNSLSAYTYFAQGKELYYGWNQVRELAEAFPEIPFKVVGSNGIGVLDFPINVEFLGWLNNEEMTRLRNETPIFLRLPMHDGFSMSVLEAMGAGCEVIWNQELRGCHLYNTSTPIEQFSSILTALKQRNLARNTQNIEYIASNFEKQHVLNNFFLRLKSLAK